jgi:uncharacterized protein (TIGR03118 family)
MENPMRKQFSLVLGFVLFVSPALAHSFAATTFTIVKLVSNQSGKAKNADPNLINPWGLAQGPGTDPIWAADNGTGLSTVYAQGTGKVENTVVAIPKGSPTGIVYAPSIGFQISETGKTGDSSFIFDSISGVISGWSSSVDAQNAVIAIDNSASGAQYTGLALDAGSKLLFAANFAQNQVEVYDNKWKPVTTFTDKKLTGYAPYNVAIINGAVYVAFANFSTGSGYVEVFSESGTLKQKLIAKGPLDAPWGMTIAPSKFGTFANALLVGNLGNGKINAFDPGTGNFLGTLTNKAGKALKISGLWALDPVPTGDVTFSAGPNGYAAGLIGLIKPAK